MAKDRERAEITWIFGIVIACLLLGSAGIYYANSSHPGLAEDNTTPPTTTGSMPSANAGSRDAVVHEGPVR